MNHSILRITRSATVIVALGIMSLGIIAAVEKKDSEDDLMQQKLTHAQTAIEGLALEDFAKIEKSGQELLLISEQAQWAKIQTPKYAQFSGEFRANVTKMIEAAQARNLDGATMSFMQVTMSCVECHKVVRSGQKVATAK